ncbi:sugar nucleotide-binding protein [Ornithinimicrobium tianjinense]|uniref:dTDP-4-dehydrorhamnose reductase n=1 Tax=Ornithinimicrobium tianjinense TaxID=1195761 RepID=A0A917F4M1_9MICO|nr:bifunctional dTDP-4-dehydrorhamnose 3,5-epimerase family protein/NAD(P)-dependent oxidoreductase [Ornithinimicrobium tianjinense]GGF42326.1 dTDP-4-dehydrorhamnose reductase [Ornithinimicrobium tianjinense]
MGGDALRVRETGIPGLLVVDLPLHGDARGWFKENWQRAKMVAAGLPDFGPVQHSVAHNGRAGVTRGIHAEPWDKFVSVVHGRAFGAWVDLREGPTFGAVHTEELDEATAVFVPRGVGNSYQTLVDDTVYSYLVNDHWRPDADYTMLNLADETVAVPWPLPLETAEISEKDRAHPRLAEVTPVPARPTLVIGAGGQLGQALLAAFPGAVGLTRDQLDLADPGAVEAFDLSPYAVVINAAAYTAVDLAETEQGRREAWAANATGVAALARAAARHGLTLVHYSSDYVFDGTSQEHHEDEPLSPLGVYGQSKAAGDLAVSVAPRHYLLRTSWVVGQGSNFVATMRSLAERGASPSVVHDQVGRLTFADDLARATAHLLSTRAPYGTYNVTNDGAPASWEEVARQVFTRLGATGTVRAVSSAEYAAGRDPQSPLAPRPARSVLRLDRLRATGFAPRDQWAALDEHLR